MNKIILNKKYQKLFTTDDRYIICTGGRGSAKSYSITTYFTLLLHTETNHTILFTRYTKASTDASIISEMIHKISILGLESEFEITNDEIVNKATGSKMIFRGLQISNKDQSANLKSLQGVTIWCMDEAEELRSEEVFDTIDYSIRSNLRPNKIIMILNPSTKEHFIYTKFFQDNGVPEGFNGTKNGITFIHTSYLDNLKHLPDSYIQGFEALKIKNPAKYLHKVLGGWLNKAEGVIFNNWTIGDFSDQLEYGYGVDFGFSNDPSTLTKVAIDKKNKIIYIDEKLYEPGLTTSELGERFRNECSNKQIIADNSEPRLIEELKRMTLNIKACIKGAGSVSEGITLMQDYQIIITPSSTNLLKEFNNYVWNDKKSGTPVDMYNHCFVADTLITTDKGLVKIIDINVGDKVLTSNGYKPVLKKFNNGLQQVFDYSLHLDTDVVYLTCTNNHKIKTQEEWKEIQNLKQGNVLFQHKNIKEKSITYTQMKCIIQKVVKDYIELYGKQILEQYKKDFTSTILMKIQQIIELKIFNWLKEENIYLCMQKNTLKTIQNGSKISIQKVLKQRKNGINQKMVYNGIVNKVNKVGLIGDINDLIVKYVEKNMKQDIQEYQNTAIKTVKLKHLEQGESRMEQVYDIMVEDTHEYFANSILVHNCIDGIRYYVSHILKAPTGKYYL